MKRRVLAGLVLVGVLGISGAAFAGISLKPTAKQGVDAPVRRPLTPHEIKRLQEQGKPVPPDLMTPPPPGYQQTKPSTPQRPTPQRPIDPPSRPDVQRPSDSGSRPYRPTDQTPTRPKRPSDYEPQRPSGTQYRPDDRRPPFSRDRIPPRGTDEYRPPMPERR